MILQIEGIKYDCVDKIVCEKNYEWSLIGQRAELINMDISGRFYIRNIQTHKEKSVYIVLRVHDDIIKYIHLPDRKL